MTTGDSPPDALLTYGAAPVGFSRGLVRAAGTTAVVCGGAGTLASGVFVFEALTGRGRADLGLILQYSARSTIGLLLLVFGTALLLRSRIVWHTIAALMLGLMLEPLMRLAFGARTVIRTWDTEFSWFNDLTLFASPIAANLSELLILLVILLLLALPGVKATVTKAATDQ